MKWLRFVPTLMQISSIILKLQAVKQSGPAFLAYPVDGCTSAPTNGILSTINSYCCTSSSSCIRPLTRREGTVLEKSAGYNIYSDLEIRYWILEVFLITGFFIARHRILMRDIDTGYSVRPSVQCCYCVETNAHFVVVFVVG